MDNYWLKDNHSVHIFSFKEGEKRKTIHYREQFSPSHKKISEVELKKKSTISKTIKLQFA